ncbi:MAG: homoserine O-succinyltransferase [Bacteroidales bacterium]|nr:homoserine O-succinyltransferase [Bacteroidales bacterium]
MPINIPDALPARRVLESENVFVMGTSRAMQQDIRPLRIMILNLMPVKIITETQILRNLSNSPLQVNVEFMKMSSHTSKNTSNEHLDTFYKCFDEVRSQKYDGLIITGAPVEQMPFEEVDYWSELTEIMEWSKSNVTNTFHICWGAQAGLYYHYGIDKYQLPEKMFGVFEHHIVDDANEPLLRGFDEVFRVPHSRHTSVRREAVIANENLKLLAESDDAGVYIIVSRDRRQIFVSGHSEYDRDTLASEYMRDKTKGLPIKVPANYFPNDDPTQKPIVTWKSHASLLYSNWLNYYVYQATPYEW